MLLWNGEVTEDQLVTRGGGLLWRTAKRDVLQQLGLPSQTQVVAWCRFSDVERYCYDQLEVEILDVVRRRWEEQQIRLAEEGNADAPDDEHVGDDVVQEVWRLRQLCCHPQVGQALQAIRPRVTNATSHRRRHHRRAARLRRTDLSPANSASQAVVPLSGRFAGMSLMTMDDFLEELLDKSRIECEEAQRKIIAAQNGLASLALIDKDVTAAILKYLVVMKMIRDNWQEVRADLLPRLHILENCVKCLRELFSLDAIDAIEATTDERNPKTDSMMPELPALSRAVVLDDREQVVDYRHNRDCRSDGRDPLRVHGDARGQSVHLDFLSAPGRDCACGRTRALPSQAVIG
ncbi:hypothetical protein PINS_up020356 [Pythium insidiosum]|nr:hypothetical protein PINS_up020356 [Pythium insidiosum]